jgi:biopolymer transport protein ExbD
MGSRFHASRMRRAERHAVAGHGSINLVPLIDILTSIVFFSLLTYSGAVMAALTAYDLSLPPTVITAEQATQPGQAPELNLLLAVRLEENAIQVEHSEEGGFRQRLSGVGDASLVQLEALMKQIHERYPQNNDVLVVPNDGVSYDNVIKVLERLRAAQYSGISLGSRARGTAPAAPATPARR